MVKRDANHTAVVAHAQRLGALVVDLASQGNGCPDILVGHRGQWSMWEIKDGAKKASARRLRANQVTFFAVAKARGLPCYKVETIADATALLMLGVAP